MKQKKHTRQIILHKDDLKHQKRFTFVDCNRILASIDYLLSQQINLILHHPTFQKLEATWRGLLYLIQQQVKDQNLKVRVLDVNWLELSNDLYNAIEFDQSQLFKKVYTNEFDHPGGEPFGLLVCDYYVRLKPKQANSPVNDIETLYSLSGVAAAAFAPCVLGVDADFFGLNQFSEFEHLNNIRDIFASQDYQSWKKLRSYVDARFLSLVLPRINLRLPYRLGDNNRQDGFCFKEDCSNIQDYLWGNPVYGLAAVVIRSFCQTGWFLNIKGNSQIGHALDGGIVEGLPTYYYQADTSPYFAKPCVETSFKIVHERELTNLGFITLSVCQYTSLCVFYTCPTIYERKLDSVPVGFSNAELFSYPLYNILIISRFAHYLKVIGRNKIGSFIIASQYQSFLQNWISYYTGQPSGDVTQEILAKYPLAESDIKITESPGNSTHYFCKLAIRPHTHIQGYNEMLDFNFPLPKLIL